jgi:chromate reductase
MLGTARAQYDLRRSFVFLNMYPMNQPEVMVPFAQDKVDKNGRVIDEKTRKKIREFLESLVAWAKRMKIGDEESARMTKLAA